MRHLREPMRGICSASGAFTLIEPQLMPNVEHHSH